MKHAGIFLQLALLSFTVNAQSNCFESAVINIRAFLKKGDCSLAQVRFNKIKYCDDKPSNAESIIQGLQAEIANCKKNNASVKKNTQTSIEPKESSKVEVTEQSSDIERLKELAKEGKKYYLDKNYEMAFPLLDEVKEIDDAEVWRYLGYIYDNGYFVKVNYEVSFECFRKSAELGDASSQYHVGIRYETGKGVKKDFAEAYVWYRKSAEIGNSYGQESLGEFFRKGIFVAKDGVEAVKWFRKSADQDNSYGQLYLGEMYENGEGGLSKDIKEAIKLYRQSANQNNSSAKANLKRLNVSE